MLPAVSPVRVGDASSAPSVPESASPIRAAPAPPRRVLHVDQTFAGAGPIVKPTTRATKASGMPPAGSMTARGAAGGERATYDLSDKGIIYGAEGGDGSKSARGPGHSRSHGKSMSRLGRREREMYRQPAYGSFYKNTDSPGPGSYAEAAIEVVQTKPRAPEYSFGVKVDSLISFISAAQRRSKETPGPGKYPTTSSFGKQGQSTRSVFARSAKDSGQKTAPSHRFAGADTARAPQRSKNGFVATKRQMITAGLPGVDSPGTGMYDQIGMYDKKFHGGVGIRGRAQDRVPTFSFSKSPRF